MKTWYLAGLDTGFGNLAALGSLLRCHWPTVASSHRLGFDPSADSQFSSVVVGPSVSFHAADTSPSIACLVFA